MSPGIPPARLAFYEDHKTPWDPLVEVYEWPAIVELLTQHEVTDCAALNGHAPGTPCPGGKACKAKFTLAFSPGVPREGKSRKDEHVEAVSLLVYDFDHLTRTELEGVCQRLEGLESLLYSTHSHEARGPDDCCVRIVFPLARPLLPHEFRFLRQTVIARYGLEWYRPRLDGGSPALVGADPNPKDLSRLYFLPTAPQERADRILAGHEPGALLDLDELLKGCPAPSARREAPPAVDVPLASPTVNLDELRALLKSYKPKHQERDDGEPISRAELVRRVYQREPLVRAEEEGQREKSCHRVGKILAYLLPLSTPTEAVAELVRPSIIAMPVYDTDGPEDAIDQRFLKVDYSWRRGVQERVAMEAQLAAEREADKVRARKIREKFKRRGGSGGESIAASVTPLLLPEGAVLVGETGAAAPPLPPPPPPVAPEEPAPAEEPDDEWEQLLIYRQTKAGPVLQSMLANVVLILSMHPEWTGLLRYNELSKDVEVKGNTPLDAYEHAPQIITTAVKNWLQARYECAFTTADVQDALLHVARSNAYNPLREYLLNVRPDGQPRIDAFLERYCGAATVDGDGHDISAYVRKVSRRWFLGAVARGLTPGCKNDTVLVLEGKTGIYKSTALKVLGGPFFSDSKLVIHDKDAMMHAGTNWIHEIAELAAFHAVETEEQKAFFSSPVDRFRAPYDRAMASYPRLACFVGSTNRDQYLNDDTGNRRYWPVFCERPFRLQDLRRDRDLLWAEAVAIFQAGRTCLRCQALNVAIGANWPEVYGHERCDEHRWWFDSAENDLLERINRPRLRASYADAIREYLLRLSPNVRREAYGIYEIATDMLKLPPDRVEGQAPAIGRALKALDFEKTYPREDGRRVTKYVTPPELLKAAKKMPAHLRVVQGGQENQS